MIAPDEETRLLFARINDMISCAEKGSCGISNFLSPHDKYFSGLLLAERGMTDNWTFFGGCEGCERERLFVFPDYMTGDGCEELRREELTAAVAAVRVGCGGFGKRPLTHRDFLGACVGLGITRDKLGDIALTGDGAWIFCDPKIAGFICETLTSVGSEGVKCSIGDPGRDFRIRREFADISGTVASARIDCVIAELCSVSRDRAQELIKAGLVEVWYQTCEKPDRIFDTPFTVSVRGYGKYNVLNASEQTRKGRLRLSAQKYV